MPEMAQFVYDFYQNKLQNWKTIKNQEDQIKQKSELADLKKKLDEEEKVLKNRLIESIQNSKLSLKRRMNIESDSSSENESEIDYQEIQS